LKNYPNLVKYLGEEGYRLMSPKGTYLGLPYYTIETRDGLAIRKDWLAKLNLPMPRTLDEFYETAKAFVLKDPDGNGQNDTIGISLALSANGDSLGSLDYLKGTFGLPNGWGEKDGQLVPYELYVDELKSFTAFLHKAYEEGVLDKDFAVNKPRDPLTRFEAGKVGISYVNPNEVNTLTIPPIRKITPNAEVVPLDPPIGPKGQAVPTGASLQKVVINAKISEKKQQRILKLFDYMMSDEGFDLIKNGIEGIHYKKNGDTYEKLNAFDNDRPFLLSIWFLRRYDPNIQVRKWDNPQYEQMLRSWFDRNASFKWPNPAVALQSPTADKQKVGLDAKFTETLVKVITGKLPPDAIGKAAEEWRKNGGDKIIQEINDDAIRNK
jgi:putative aldouronate transport system substrate-binding protein